MWRSAARRSRRVQASCRSTHRATATTASTPDAARFDVTRNPQGHLAFGQGIHFCLGAPLARLEAKVVFEELLRLRNIERTGEAERIDSVFLRGLKHLPLAFEPAEVRA